MAWEVQLGRHIYTGSANKENENEVTHVPKSVGGGTDSESLKCIAETTSTSDLQKCAKLMCEKKRNKSKIIFHNFNTTHLMMSSLAIGFFCGFSFIIYQRTVATRTPTKIIMHILSSLKRELNFPKKGMRLLTVPHKFLDYLAPCI